MATRKVQSTQNLQAVQQAAAPQGPQLTVEIPTSITLKDVVVIVTALITIISSWTFYTMRLSVLEQKFLESKNQVEKINAEIDQLKKDIQELKMREQALEIRLQYNKR